MSESHVIEKEKGCHPSCRGCFSCHNHVGDIELSSRHPLTEEEVRKLIVEQPGDFRLEVRNETINFTSLELVPVEESPFYEDFKNRENLPDKVWVVEYEAEARVWSPLEHTPTPFRQMFIRIIIDAYEGWKIRVHAEIIDSLLSLG